MTSFEESLEEDPAVAEAWKIFQAKPKMGRWEDEGKIPDETPWKKHIDSTVYSDNIYIYTYIYIYIHIYIYINCDVYDNLSVDHLPSI